VFIILISTALVEVWLMTRPVEVNEALKRAEKRH